jgi:hypothetical protein
MDATNTTTDLAALINQLDADVIRQRLDTLSRERKALLVLLRAALRARAPLRRLSSDEDRLDASRLKEGPGEQ